jgi:SRSO17 transposase
MFAEVLAPAFGRREPRVRAGSYVLGLASGLERKNGWTLAEYAGDGTPDGMQRLLNAAVWDADKVRDVLGRYVAARLGDPDGVLIADETGFEKTGKHSAGVQRQYTGTAGKVTNCQVGVFLAYAVPAKGTRVLIDRELYIPRSWTDDQVRCALAGIPGDTKFATKPQLAKKIVERAIRAGAAVFLVHRRRGLRRQRQAAGLAGGCQGRLRGRGRVRPPGSGRRRPHDPRRRPRREGPGPRLAADVVRARLEGRAVV